MKDKQELIQEKARQMILEARKKAQKNEEEQKVWDLSWFLL